MNERLLKVKIEWEKDLDDKTIILADSKQLETTGFDISKFISGGVDGNNGRMAIRDILDEKRIKLITRLGNKEIHKVARGFFFSKYFEDRNLTNSSVILKSFYDYILVLRVSYKGMSREEHIRGLQTELRQALEEIKNEKMK